MVKASLLLAALVLVSTVAACADSDTAVVREGEPGWSEIEHPPPAIADRNSPVIVWAGTELVVFGGVRRTGETFVVEFLNDGAVFDPSTNAWYPLPAPPFKAALHQPRGLWTGEILVVGGLRCGDKAFWESAAPTNCPAEGFDLAAYDSRSQRWDAIELPDELDRTPCGWLSGSTGTEVIIDQCGAGLWAIDTHTDAVRMLSAPPFIPPSICSGDGWVISSGFLDNAEAPGGGDSPPTNGSDLRSGQAPHQTSIEVDYGVTVLDAGGGWSPVSALDVGFVQSLSLDGACAGSFIVVFWSSEGINHGALFDPEAGAWRPAALPPAPIRIQSGSTTWTGEELLVLHEEARLTYNPIQDVWRTLPPYDKAAGDLIWAGDRAVVIERGEQTFNLHVWEVPAAS